MISNTAGTTKPLIKTLTRRHDFKTVESLPATRLIFMNTLPPLRKSASQVVLSRMQLTLHATRRTPHGASRLVRAMSAWLVTTRRAPSRHSRDARVYGHTTTAMHKLSTVPPPFMTSLCFAVLFCTWLVRRRKTCARKGCYVTPPPTPPPFLYGLLCFVVLFCRQSRGISCARNDSCLTPSPSLPLPLRPPSLCCFVL